MRFYMLIAISSLFFIGCHKDIRLNMSISGLNVPIEGGNGREVIVIKPFSDNRSEKQRCGMQKDGQGDKTAEVLCNREPSEWIAQSLADELRASGFKVLDSITPHQQGVFKIEGSLLKFYVEPVLGIWSHTLETDLQVKLMVKTENGLHAERTFFAKGIKKGVQSGGIASYNVSLKRATNELLTEMVEGIFFLMNKYPQIGLSGDKSKSLENKTSEVRR